MLDTYKTRIFQEDDISYLGGDDDDDDDYDEKEGAHGSGLVINRAGSTSNRSRKSERIQRKGSRGSNTQMEEHQHSLSQRVFPRIDLPRFPGTLRSGYNIPPQALGRRSVSFNDKGRKGSEKHNIITGGQGSLSQDDRCRTWTEHRVDLDDAFGSESVNVHGFDQEKEYTSHAQEMEERSGAALGQPVRQGSIPSMSNISIGSPRNGKISDLPAMPALAVVRKGSASALSTGNLDPREVMEESEEGCEHDNKDSNSEEDDGRGVGQINISAFKGKGVRRSSQEAYRIRLEEEELAQSCTSPIEEYKTRFSSIGVELPDIYSPTTGELSRLSLDPDEMALENTRYSSNRISFHSSKRSSRHEGISRTSTRSSNRNASHRRQHDKELTTDTAETAVASTSGAVTMMKALSPKQRTRKYDPCAICIEDYEVGDHIRELPCRHFFHSHCIDPWFRDVHGICPVCKRDYSQGKHQIDTGAFK